jgi:1-acyl-sn-glycerol-3-phosphate acyltransferase
LQRGAAHIALTADSRIVPVSISCSPATLFKGNPWYKVPERRFHVRVVAGEPVDAAVFRQPGESDNRAARRLTQWLLAYYANELDTSLRDAGTHEPSDSYSCPAPAAN